MIHLAAGMHRGALGGHQGDHHEEIQRELGVELARDDEEDEEEHPGGASASIPLILLHVGLHQQEGLPGSGLNVCILNRYRGCCRRGNRTSADSGGGGGPKTRAPSREDALQKGV